MATRVQSPPPSSYPPMVPFDTNSPIVKDSASSTRSSRSSFSFKHSGFRRVLGILQKEPKSSSSPSNPGVRPHSSSSRRIADGGSPRGGSEAGSVFLPVSTSGLNNSNSRANSGGFLYRSRNAKSMDALKLFSKSTLKSAPASSNGPTNTDPTIRPTSLAKDVFGNMIKDESVSPPVLRLQADGDESSSSHRPSGSMEMNRSLESSQEAKSSPSQRPSPLGDGAAITRPPSSDANNIGEENSKGVENRASTLTSLSHDPTRATIPFPSPSIHPNTPPSTSRGQASEECVVSNPLPISKEATITAKPRPPKPSLSIPIPTLHTKAATAPADSPSRSMGTDIIFVNSGFSSSSATPAGSAISNATPSASDPRMKLPPSPGLSLRVTPSITMSRPVWPLPPLPPMDRPPGPSSSSDSSSPPSNSQTSNTSKKPSFRLPPPTRSHTLPTHSASEGGGADLNRRASERISRGISAQLDSMPSLNVMGETEHGDPEADDDDMEDIDDEDEGSGEGDDMGGGSMGRPSIDSVMSMDSSGSMETARARGPEAGPSSLRTEGIVGSSSTLVAGATQTKDIKGKGRQWVSRANNEEDGSASDSDDSVYFDARDSVFLSPKDVPKVMERRQSQRQSIHSSRGSIATSFGTVLDPSVERHKRDSTWSFNSARESAYYTPIECFSAFASPNASSFASAQSDLLKATTTAHVASKGASVPVGLGDPPSGASTVNVEKAPSRRGGDSRFSMSRFNSNSRDGLPNIDLSTLGFDASQPTAGMLTPGSGMKGKGSGVSMNEASQLPDGLPNSRQDGLPDFDTAVPFTNGISHSADNELRTPRMSGYFDNHTASASSLSNMLGSATSGSLIPIRRGSVSLSVPPPVNEGEDMAETEHQDSNAIQGRSAHLVCPAQAADPHTAGIGPPLYLSSGAGLSPSKPIPTPPSVPGQRSLPSESIPSLNIHISRQGTINNGKRRPVYRQASRSMVELSTSSTMDRDDSKDDNGLDSHVTPPLPTVAPVKTPVAQTPVDDPLSWLVPPPSPVIGRPNRHGTIRKVSSVPLLSSGDMPGGEKPPPSYESIPRREEEGKEKLPSYTNDIFLAGLLSRKMEFDRPGLQSRDRSWKKFWCVLEGTSFKVYKVGTLETKFGALAAAPVASALPPTSATAVLTGRVRHGSTFSVSNIASRIISSPHSGTGSSSETRSRSSSGPATNRPEPLASSSPSWKTPLSDTSRTPGVILTKNQQALVPSSAQPSSPASSVTNATRNSTSGSSYTPSRSSFSPSRPSTPASNNPRPTEPERPIGHGPGGRSLINNGGFNIYIPPESSLIRQYTLQNGESGLATDYVKRKNVIRIRLEGQQFLLQLPGVEEVVSWIEGFQAAANIALDLDIRPMPKGALYPRRRRRRRPRQAGEPATRPPLSPVLNATTDSANTTSR